MHVSRVDRQSAGVATMTRTKLGMLTLMAYAFAVPALAGDIPTAVPEPGTLGLMAVGIAGILAARLRKRK
jgi:hypothetical protein